MWSGKVIIVLELDIGGHGIPLKTPGFMNYLFSPHEMCADNALLVDY